MKKILLTFTGFHDPYTLSVVDGRQQAGPIISMLGERSFDKVVLFNTPGASENTAITADALTSMLPQLIIEVKALENLHNPTDHIAILRYLRHHAGDLRKAHPDDEFYISLASGTPSMHACWLLLVADGTIPARILYGHSPRNTEGAYVVTEVDLTANEFPHIMPKDYQLSNTVDYICDLSSVCEELQIVGNDKVFLTALDRVARLAQYKCNILVLGETGTGKEHVARLFHRMASHRKGPFVAINCAAMPKDLAESILFGHEKGTFTGAVRKQDGEFLLADGGTLFLDEIGDMPSEIQAKLLRVLQDGIIKPLGGSERKVDVCVVAATNLNLGKAIKEGQFRPDLAQRFIDTIELPPLCRRRGDIIKLATFTLSKWNQAHNTSRRMSKSTLEELQTYSWPGNVRELTSSIERAAMTAKKDIIQATELRLGEAAWLAVSDENRVPEPHDGFLLKDYIDNVREKLFNRAINISSGNYAQAAKLLGVSPQAVHKFARKDK